MKGKARREFFFENKKNEKLKREICAFRYTEFDDFQENYCHKFKTFSVKRF